MSDLHVVILAAGKGTRMKSALPKVLHLVAGLPMIEHVLATAATLLPATVTVVIGHGGDLLREALARHVNVGLVVQNPQLGTAHALLATEGALATRTGTLLLLSGDVPLLNKATLDRLLAEHRRRGAALTVLTAHLATPGGYGRIVRVDGDITRIVEERDASEEERRIPEINAGIYAFDLAGLFDAVRSIAAENAQREYYLPDLVAIYRRRGLTVATSTCDDAVEVLGINSRSDLAAANRHIRHATNAALMAAGVTLENPDTTYVSPDSVVGPDTILRAGVTIERGTIIGTNCEVHGGTRIVNSVLGDRVVVLDHSLIVDSRIEDDASVGPFAHLRMQSSVGAGAKVGNFVELKQTTLGSGSRSMHHAYLGDTSIGRNVNIGAGTITCNYDGTRKHKTVIEDGAFIGSDTQLVAPVTVGQGAYVGTGTTVRADVPDGALAVSAGKQRNIEHWVEQRRRKQQS